MPDSTTKLAYAKLNLSLDITGRRPDGYHTISTIMQSIDIADVVSVERTDDAGEIIIKCNSDEIKEDSSNIAYKAAKMFFDATNISTFGVEIKIKKNIPVAAGLGGGSADAAAVLVAMNEIFNTQLEIDELCDIAEQVGMDVPFCIQGGTQLAEGLGSILSPLPPVEKCAFVIVKDDEKSSTADMYAKIDSSERVVHPETSMIIDYVCEGDEQSAAKLLCNSFAPLWGEKYESIRLALLDCGAINATLSGSGPVVFGIFTDVDDAKRCKSMLDSTYETVIVAEPVNFGIEEK